MRRLTLPIAALFVLAGAATALSADHVVHVGGTSPSQFQTFHPDTVTIALNDTVKWTFDTPSDADHSVTADPGQKESFDSDPNNDDPNHPPGVNGFYSFSHRYTHSGRFTYFCKTHADMTGKVIVLDSDGSPPGPPKITGLKVDPKKFCKTKTDQCPKPGAKLKFTLSEKATKVSGPIIRRKDGKTIKTVTYKERPAGANSISFSGSGLARAKYKIKLKAYDALGHKPLSAVTAYFEVAKTR
jgi:plastocyanin